MGIDEVYDSAGARPGRERFDPANPGMQAINPAGLFDGSQLFSQVIVAPRGRTAWISGLIGCAADNRLVSSEKPAQIQQAFANLRIAIGAAGARAEDCVRITEYVVAYSAADLAPIKAGIRALFPAGRLPTNVVVPVPRLGRDGALFEIDAFCVLPD